MRISGLRLCFDSLHSSPSGKRKKRRKLVDIDDDGVDHPLLQDLQAKPGCLSRSWACLIFFGIFVVYGYLLVGLKWFTRSIGLRVLRLFCTLVPRFPTPENFGQLFNWAPNLLLRFECLGNV